MHWLLKQLKKNVVLKFTAEYVEEQDVAHDFRKRIHFKNPLNVSEFKPYFQVFDDRNGFIPNLSIVDLLFNQGPQSKLYI